jgi:hypothetical protein
MSVERFALDGPDLAKTGATISVKGWYMHVGNFHNLYRNPYELAESIHPGRYSPTSVLTVGLLPDDAPRAAREQLIQCQTTQQTSLFGCALVVGGTAGTCSVYNAFGTVTRNTYCLKVEWVEQCINEAAHQRRSLFSGTLPSASPPAPPCSGRKSHQRALQGGCGAVVKARLMPN